MAAKKSLSLNFEKSEELKRTFNACAELWCKKHRLGLSDLAERCGVSLQYLSHIGRYGRIPGKPILILLALNFEFPNPQDLFRMAGIKEPWPFEQGLGLRTATPLESGLLSLSFNAEGFTSLIRKVVREETQPRRLSDLLNGRPLRVGLNTSQFFMFDKKQKTQDGFFPELMRSLALSLQCGVSVSEVAHSEFSSKLGSGEIDVYGPIYRTPQRLQHALFTDSFCSIELAGIGRIKPLGSLALLPPPAELSDLRRSPYVIAVHRDSMAHHYAEVELGIPSSNLVLCELADEALERILLTNIPRPAHLVLTDRPFAKRAWDQHSKELNLLFTDQERDTRLFEDTIAVRSDWPSVMQLLNDSLDLLRKSGTVQRIFDRTVSVDRTEGVRISI